MSKKLFTYFTLPLLLLFCNGTENSIAQPRQQSADNSNATVERMIVANGNVVMNLNSKTIGGASASSALRFNVSPDSFFTLIVSNNLLRGPEQTSMNLTAADSKAISAILNGALNHLSIVKTGPTEAFDLVVRDSQSGLTLFNVDGHLYNYDASQHLVSITGGRLLISPEFAQRLGHGSQAGAVAGNISITTTVYPIEVNHVVNGVVQSSEMPAMHQPAVGTIPGPDVIVGDLPAVQEPTNGGSGNYVGLGVATTSCNAGVENLDWFQLPSNDHPVIPQNLYRMSGGADNTERFEQIGQSWLKHAFTALTENVCGYGCNGVGGSHLGSGCSDPYSASLNYGQSGLGSRAWVNPFTGFYPGSNPNPANHTGHTHTGISHRVTVLVSDLNTTLNVGAKYFAEGQYITPHEYSWCQTHPGQCNMYNNVSYRQFTVTGTTGPFSFSPAAATVRTKPAIIGWTGASTNTFEPEPGVDGVGILGFKVTNPSAGVWHYEYAVYNENLDRAIQSFSVPLGCGVTVSNLGFHAPTQEPGWANDGTQNNQGFSSTPWASTQTTSSVTWNSETFAQNQNANAIRWGTLYNFRFDSNRPPTNANATVGFFKTGNPITVQVQAPTADPCNPLQLTTVVSRKTHGAAGTFDVNLPLSGSPGVECRGTGGDYAFVFTFTNTVVSGNASVTTGTGNVSGVVFSGNTMTVNLTGVTDEQQIAVTATNVMDNFGQTLPDTAVNAVILVADSTANSTVNASDVAQIKGQVGVPVDATNFRTDINATGTVNASDVGQAKADIGNSVP